MAKKRKTLRQKRNLDNRLQTQQTTPPLQETSQDQLMPKPYEYVTKLDQTSSRPTIHVITQDYQFVSKDLLRTAIVTTAIVAAQLILFFSKVLS